MIQGVVSARTIKPNTEMTASVQENRIKTHKTLTINAFSMSTRQMQTMCECSTYVDFDKVTNGQAGRVKTLQLNVTGVEDRS